LIADAAEKPYATTVTTIHGTVVVPEGFRNIRTSPDGEAHACMMYSETTKQMRLICLFLPPSM